MIIYPVSLLPSGNDTRDEHYRFILFRRPSYSKNSRMKRVTITSLFDQWSVDVFLAFISFMYMYYMYVVCVCECICMCEKEGERKRDF